MKTPFLAAALAVFRKDMQAELRSRELISAMTVFALLSVLAFNFALELDRIAREEAVSGVLWVTVIFASIIGLNRSLAIERDQSNFDAMLLAPIDRSAIFCGKLLGNFLLTLLIGVLLCAVMTIMFNFNLVRAELLTVLLLGTLGLTTTGTLLAAITVQSRSRETLLPIVLLPVALPVLLSAVRATNALLMESAGNDWASWLQILAVVDIVYLVLCFLLFDYVIED